MTRRVRAPPLWCARSTKAKFFPLPRTHKFVDRRIGAAGAGMHARWAMQGEQAAAQCCDGRTPLCPLSLPPSLFVPPPRPLGTDRLLGRPMGECYAVATVWFCLLLSLCAGLVWPPFSPDACACMYVCACVRACARVCGSRAKDDPL
eukprot:COSAG03_NODE_1279_length_4412_cov_20.059355_4_plen_147_part_00